VFDSKWNGNLSALPYESRYVTYRYMFDQRHVNLAITDSAPESHMLYTGTCSINVTYRYMLDQRRGMLHTGTCSISDV
jgi:hypothetical protein